MSRLHLDLSWEEDEVEAEPAVRWQRNRDARDDDRYLWFSTYVRPSDVVEATEHQPKYEYSVTGRKRIKPGSRTTTLGTKVTVNGINVAIFKYGGGFYAIQDACPHQAASLHLGDIEDIDGTLCISCPRHRWPFSLEDGQCIIPVNRQAECYPVRIRRERDGSKGPKRCMSIDVDRLFGRVCGDEPYLEFGSMGATQSSSQLHPVREPTALLSTDAGVIVRIPDATSGASTYQHNQRLLTRPTAIVEDVHEGKSSQQTHVAIVKPGERNQALKGSIVYLKKTSRSSIPPPQNP